MKLAWDYTELAPTYDRRPGYAPRAIDALLAVAGLGPGDRVCDVGAGTGASALPLLDRGLRVVAVEPNEAMRRRGVESTRERPGIAWLAAVGEATGLAAGAFDLVVFGSSLNVLACGPALAEAARLLRAGGSVACLYNHRRLDDPLQARIESILRRHVPGYRHGARREDHRDLLASSGRFTGITGRDVEVVHEVDAEAWADAWRSHATLVRQAGPALEEVLREIRAVTLAAGTTVAVPYTTRLWTARKRTAASRRVRSREARVKDAMRTTGP